MEANNYQAIQYELVQESLVARLTKSEQRIKVLEDALAGILEIGKRDMRNSKYDGYFEYAKQALASKEPK